MDIRNLTDVPQHLERLAQWHHNEWSYLNPGRTLAMRKERMQDYFSETLIPSTWVAESEGQLAGSAAIVASDMDTHPEYTPWLASVFVSPEFREQGIGAALVKQVMEEARKNGIETLYLYTPDKAGFYQKLGWQVLGEEHYHDHPVTIMSCPLTD